jgi:hypothetical protein
MGKRFWPITPAEKKKIERIFKRLEVCNVISSLKEPTKVMRWKSWMPPTG